MPNSNQFVGDIIQILSEEVGETAELARSNARVTKIKNAIEVTPVSIQGGIYEISITVDLNEAPMAAAFEYGSGEHRTRGVPRKYRIPNEPDEGVGFFWEDPPAKVGEPGFYRFPFVMHPGIQPEAYLEPAVDAKLPDLTARLAKALKDFSLDVAREVV